VISLLKRLEKPAVDLTIIPTGTSSADIDVAMVIDEIDAVLDRTPATSETAGVLSGSGSARPLPSKPCATVRAPIAKPTSRTDDDKKLVKDSHAASSTSTASTANRRGSDLSRSILGKARDAPWLSSATTKSTKTSSDVKVGKRRSSASTAEVSAAAAAAKEAIPLGRPSTAPHRVQKVAAEFDTASQPSLKVAVSDIQAPQPVQNNSVVPAMLASMQPLLPGTISTNRKDAEAESARKKRRRDDAKHKPAPRFNTDRHQ
jgi:hypothetical protein